MEEEKLSQFRQWRLSGLAVQNDPRGVLTRLPHTVASWVFCTRRVRIYITRGEKLRRSEQQASDQPVRPAGQSDSHWVSTSWQPHRVASGGPNSIIPPSTGQENDIAQPKTDKCLNQLSISCFIVFHRLTVV